jgi:hypothetical protein
MPGHLGEKAMTPLVICSTTNWKALSVLSKSLEAYLPPSVPIYLSTPDQEDGRTFHNVFKWVSNACSTFGESYNRLMEEAWADGHDRAILVNDDVVIDPSTYWLLEHDRVLITQQGRKVGFLGARSNMASLHQNIRNRQKEDTWAGMKWASEDNVAQTEWLAPLFCSVPRETVFPPINFFSDNVACEDLAKQGYEHFVSRAYVHHVGSGTIGRGGAADSKNMIEAEDWLKLNRPDLHKRYFGSSV